MVQTEKIKAVEETREKLDRSQSVAVVIYKGLTVAQMQDLRGQLRESGSEMKVTKNRLAKIALKDGGYDELDDILKGPTALVYGFDDPTSAPKVCSKYAKKNDKLQILGGLLGKQRIDTTKLQALAKMPSREELLTQMAGTMKAPIRKMATSMNQAVAKVVYAMKDRAKQLEEAS